jgi:hypothetical protein
MSRIIKRLLSSYTKPMQQIFHKLMALKWRYSQKKTKQEVECFFRIYSSILPVVYIAFDSSVGRAEDCSGMDSISYP